LKRSTVIPIALTVCLCAASICPAGSREAYEKVREGIRQYEANDYAAAAKTFGKALSASPHDLRIVYNQACAAKARDELDTAIELFQKAALCDDSRLSASCRYNLGVIAAERARTEFGEQPEEAEEETRTKGLEHLGRAVAHYRDCLSVDSDHRQARHNIELIRLWIKNMEQIWRERDRQRARDQMDLMTFLRYIDAQQRGVRSRTRFLGRLPDSPKRRQAVRITATSQRELAEEIEPLKRKIEAAIDEAFKAQGGGTEQGLTEEDRKARLDPLLELADAAGRQMLSAGSRLEQQQLAEANDAETDAIKRLDELFMDMTDFPHLLERAIEEEQTLVDNVATAVENSDQAALLDTPDLAWRQRFVEDWARMLAIKARAGLSRLNTLGVAVVPGDDSTSPPDENGRPQSPDPSRLNESADFKEMQKKLEPLKKSMEKAVELAPRVTKLTGEAADELDANKPGDALPQQEEALKLLREIAEPLRQQQQQDQQDQEKQEQEKDKSEEQQSNQDQEEKEKQEEKQEQQQGSRQDEKRQRKQMSQKELQALLENVRERKRKRDEQLKKIRAAVARPAGVDKDW
jgi:hypothetical protein